LHAVCLIDNNCHLLSPAIVCALSSAHGAQSRSRAMLIAGLFGRGLRQRLAAFAIKLALTGYRIDRTLQFR